MHLFQKPAILILIILVSRGCSYKKEALLIEPCPDLSGTISFSMKVEPLMNTKCKYCHNNNSPQGNISLEGYQNIRQSALTGKLYGSITHASGFYAMPKYKPKLDQCTIEMVKKWIANGAPDN